MEEKIATIKNALRGNGSNIIQGKPITSLPSALRAAYMAGSIDGKGNAFEEGFKAGMGRALALFH
ncbi:MAG: hypothetical protein AAGM67_08335, partial [Bacteroidota bacterium]